MIQYSDRDEAGTVTCDGCGETDDIDGVGFFSDFVDEIKERGWRIGRDGGDWTHTCPDCADND